MTEEMKLEVAKLTLDYLARLQNDGTKNAIRKIELSAEIKKDEATFSDLYNAVFLVIAKSINPSAYPNTKARATKVAKSVTKPDTDSEPAKASH